MGPQQNSKRLSQIYNKYLFSTLRKNKQKKLLRDFYHVVINIIAKS